MKSIKFFIIAILLIMPLTTNAKETNNLLNYAIVVNSGSKTDSYPSLINPIDNENKDNKCTPFINKDGDSTPLADFIEMLFKIIKIATPVIMIILTIIDFATNIINGTEKEIKAILKKALIRFIIGVLIFLLPFILELLFNIFGLYDLQTCI